MIGAYRPLSALTGVALAIALTASAGTGAVVNGWRLDGSHQREMADKQAEYDALLTKVREQNHAVDAMAAASKAADARHKVAESYAAGIIKNLDRRAAAVTASTATNCEEVLREAWSSTR